MTSPTLSLWINASLDSAARADLERATASDSVMWAPPVGVLQAGAPAEAAPDATVLFGQPDPTTILRATTVRWVHISSAGYTRYDQPDFWEVLRHRNIAFTNSSHVWNRPCAEWALAVMLAHGRQLAEAWHTQHTDRSWPHAAQRDRCRILAGATVLILGWGAIGQQLATLLEPFQCRLLAHRRRPLPSDSPVHSIGLDDLPRALGEADYVVNVLPEHPGTHHFVDTSRLASMTSSAVFINLGRGPTVDQDALVTALRSGQIAAAYLDVTDPEPLPPEHPLWTAPGCWITPHTSGGSHDELRRVVAHFLENLRRFRTGEPLLDRVV